MLKFRSRYLSVGLALVVALGGGVLVANVARAAVSDDKIGLIVDNCESIRLNLKKVRTSDALTRVGLGRNYEFMLNKMMVNMNSRLATNHKDAGDLLSITAKFSENLEYFRKNYILYDQQIGRLENIDCRKNPRDFYESLEKARWLRGEVRFNFTKLNELLEEYEMELEGVARRL